MIEAADVHETESQPMRWVIDGREVDREEVIAYLEDLLAEVRAARAELRAIRAQRESLRSALAKSGLEA